MIELTGVAQEPGEARRRWFRGSSLELVVWEDDEGPRMYQLRYRDPAPDGVLEWRRGRGLFHYTLDDGEDRAARAKATPLLRAEPAAPLAEVRRAFAREGEGLDERIRLHVERTLGRNDEGGGS